MWQKVSRGRELREGAMKRETLRIITNVLETWRVDKN